jgi:hypothetical protein
MRARYRWCSKLNSKTDIPSAIDPLSPVNAAVEDAVRLGADAVGYTQSQALGPPGWGARALGGDQKCAPASLS